MRHRWLLYAVVALSALNALPIGHTADEVPSTTASTTTTTVKAIPVSTTTTTTASSATPTTTATTTTTTTTEKPKIKILDNALCKKCDCDDTNKLIDCSGKLGKWFTSDEWTALQSGNIIFETIKMEHNNLTEVPQLPEYPVKNLYLGFNQITKVAIAAFQNLGSLTILDLSHNNLTTKALVPDVFKGKYSPEHYQPLDNMKELDLGHNELHTLNADLFEHLPHLEVLILCRNIFHVIDQLAEAAVSGIASLKTLDLSYMALEVLPSNFLHGPRELEKLILTGNLFKKLPEHLDYAINLKELMLDENSIPDLIGENVFPSMPNLEFLSISYMPDLTKIGPGALSKLPKLSMLLASNNPKLVSINATAFSKPTINPDILDYPPLTALYIHNNNLTVFEHDWVKRWDKVTTIDVRYNPWICNCTNSYFIHTLMVQINSSTPLLAADVVCGSPQDFKNVHIKDIQIGTGAGNLNCGELRSSGNSLIFVGLFIGIILGIPLTIGSFMVYRRGCFGMLRSNSGAGSSLYNRASFSDDFHI